jgi:hypothetical protein
MGNDDRRMENWLCGIMKEWWAGHGEHFENQ